MDYKKVKELLGKFPGAYHLEKWGLGGWSWVRVGNTNKKLLMYSDYRLIPILPEGLPPPTKEMIRDSMVFIGNNNNSSVKFTGVVLSPIRGWVTGRFNGGIGLSCVIPDDPVAEESFLLYKERTCQKETVMNRKILEMYNEDVRVLPMPLLDGTELVDGRGTKIATLFNIENGILCPAVGCKYRLETHGHDTTWAEWDDVGAILTP